jgi:arsenite-transporting ATPase
MANRDESRMQSLIMKDPVIATLSARKEKMEKARDVLTSDEIVSFVFVLNPEKLPIEETKKAVQVLSKYGIKVNDIVVNRILPEGLTDLFWKRRKEMEIEYLKEIDEYFKDKNIIKVPLIDSDVRVNDIDRISRYFG